MRIYTLELDNDIKEVNKRIAYIESLIAKIEKPDLIVLPELALTSYIGNDKIWDYADKDGVFTYAWAIAMANKYNTYIAVGYLEKKNNDYYNAYLIADKHQVYGVVYKSEGESYIFKRGAFKSIISTPFGNVAIAICYDSRRQHFYENIKDQEISLILFPHGSPSDPNKIKEEQDNNDFICLSYHNAFNVPVCYVNSIGEMGYMLGLTGKMMKKAGFKLNGLSKIYSHNILNFATNIKEVQGAEVEIKPQRRVNEIKFYDQNITNDNKLFRNLVLKPDIKAGIAYYEKHKKGNKI